MENCRNVFGAFALLASLGMTAALAGEGKEAHWPDCGKCGDLKPQATCPVMGGKINKEIYADVEGVRIYVCCKGCIEQVKADPKTYIQKIVASGERPACLGCEHGRGVKAGEGRPAGCAGCGGKACDPSKGCGHAKGGEEAGKTLTTGQLKEMLQSKKEIVLLDARAGKFDDGRRIPGARSLNAESPAEEVAKVIPSKDAKVVTYCANLKCPASRKLAEHLKGLGYTNVVEYPEGIQGWTEAGNEVEKKAEK